jgi:polyribonucleotide nucleotidyltransferase
MSYELQEAVSRKL